MSITLTCQAADVRVSIQTPAPITAVVEQAQLHSVAVSTGQGPAGPQGPRGPSGGELILNAAAVIHGNRIVCMTPEGEAIEADALNPEHGRTVVGIATNAANPGDEVVVKTQGRIVDPQWSFSSGPVVLGPSGTIVQSLPPSAAFALSLGWGDGDTLSLSIQTPYYVGV